MKKTISTLAVLLIGASILSGCGRKGPPEAPPSSMIENSEGKMVPKPKEDKPFILDRLIKQ